MIILEAVDIVDETHLSHPGRVVSANLGLLVSESSLKGRGSIVFIPAAGEVRRATARLSF